MPNPKDLTGQVFERLTVREKTAKRSSCGSIIWLCDCSCGNTTYASTAELTKGARKSCGCINKENMRAYQYKDLTGKTFGRLHVIRETTERTSGSVLWECKCDCGNIVNIRTKNLVNGKTKSCGCYNQDKARLLMNKKIEADCVEKTRLSLLNQTIPKNNTSGVRGVHLHKSSGKWVATICFQKKNYYLGYFNSLDSATNARQIAEETLWHPMLEKYVGSCTTQQEREEKTRQYLAEKVSSFFNDLSAYD